MKKDRQEKIVELVQTYEVETQEELAERLRRLGFTVTQATVSRDIRELQLTKVPLGDSRQKYAVLKQEEDGLGDRYTRVLREGFVSMEPAQNLLVIRTVSGMAMAVAMALDALKLPEVVGCIAGDDTIFVAARSAEEAKELTHRIRDLSGGM